ncbi:MAG: amidohydrolase [SAR324 cluster bacterium]|nr:amidohydrolase [SAR324 cluster bacterium]
MSKTTLPWGEEIARRGDSLVALRRDLHKHPELSMEERRTAEVIAQRLHAAGLEVRTGLAGTGVVGVLRGDQPGRVIAWRADIDALPLDEVPELPFKSVHAGVMHACGHDGHAAIAVTLAEILAARRPDVRGTAVFIFQPGEEVFGGARPMIEAGVLENPHVEEVYGLHLTTLSPAGRVWVQPGPSMASADFFNIEVKGMGGHGAFPHLSRDPITAAAHIVVGMQNLVSREIAARKRPCSPWGRSNRAASTTSSRSGPSCAARCAPSIPVCVNRFWNGWAPSPPASHRPTGPRPALRSSRATAPPW